MRAISAIESQLHPGIELQQGHGGVLGIKLGKPLKSHLPQPFLPLDELDPPEHTTSFTDGALRKLPEREWESAKRHIPGHVGYVITRDTLDDPRLHNGLLVVVNTQEMPGALIERRDNRGQMLQTEVEAPGYIDASRGRASVWRHLVQQMPDHSNILVRALEDGGRPSEEVGYAIVNINAKPILIPLTSIYRSFVKSNSVRLAAQGSVRFMPDEVRESRLGREWSSIGGRNRHSVILQIARGRDPGPHPDLTPFLGRDRD